jgi:PAS domain S-box-containing protein
MFKSGDDFVERFMESEQRLQDILDNTPAVVYAKDLEGRYLLVNRHHEELYHVSRTQALGKADYEIFPKGVADEFRANDHLVLETGRSLEVEETLPPDATHTYISLKSPLRDDSGTTYAVCSISTDITEQKRDEDEIESRVRQQAVVAELGLKGLANDDLQSLMDEAVECVARTLGVEYAKIVEVLPGSEELLWRAGVGWREGLVGRTKEDAGLGSQAGYTLLSDEPVIADDVHAETRFRPLPLLENGVVSSMTVVIPSHDRPFGVLGAHAMKRRIFSGDDVNLLQAVANVLAAAIERTLAEEALRETREAERARMARDLHDGPLQDLAYGLAEVHVAAMDLAEDPESAAASLRRASESLRRVTRGLRASVNDLRVGEQHNRPLPELVESLVERSREMDPVCEIRLEVQEGFPSMIASAADTGIGILRVIQEALTNTRRHSGARNVWVSLRAEGDRLVAQVADDERGFGAESDPGVGLGSMRQRALRLGGELEVESEPGEGTRVRLRIPMRNALRDQT